jgi:ABC-type dipeptide/oligopeptide/nickel transport system permease subunit
MVLLEIGVLLSTIAGYFAKGVSTVVDILSMLPAFVQFLLISAVFFVDAQASPNGVGLIGGSLSIITSVFHFEVTSFLLFVIAFVCGCLAFTMTVNNWFQGFRN